MTFKSRLFVILVIIILGISILIIKNDLLRIYTYIDSPVYPIYSFAFTLSGLLLILFGLTRLIFEYLQGDFIKDPDYSSKKMSKILDDIENLKEQSETISQIPEDYKEVLTQKINDLTQLQIDEITEKQNKEEILEKTKINFIVEELTDIKHRFGLDIKRMSSISNINLALGFATTVFAITYLIYSLILTDGSTETITTEIKQKTDTDVILALFLVKFLPRLTVSIFIELFSFFFLKMYRNNLAEIKYLTNERTNVESKLLALKTSILLDEKDSLAIVLSELSKTERNFILKKGETTVEIEKNKLESDNYKNILENLVKVFKK